MRERENEGSGSMKENVSSTLSALNYEIPFPYQKSKLINCAARAANKAKWLNRIDVRIFGFLYCSLPLCHSIVYDLPESFVFHLSLSVSLSLSRSLSLSAVLLFIRFLNQPIIDAFSLCFRSSFVFFLLTLSFSVCLTISRSVSLFCYILASRLVAFTFVESPIREVLGA